MINALAKNFFRGVLVIVPVAATIYVVYILIVTVDGWVSLEPWLGRRIPGAGLVVTLAAITFVGFLAGNFATRWVFRVMDELLTRVPLIRLLYNSLKDLIGAFVGDEKRFDKPVMVSLGDGVDTAVFGFLTRGDLAEFGLPGHSAVYFPQSYNFAGNLLVVPSKRVTPLDVPATSFMTLIVSGGISGDVPKASARS